MDLILIILIVGIPLVSSIYVKSNYSKYLEEENKSNLSGFEVARKILDENNLQDIHIVEVKGNLSDHYDASRKVVRLSGDVFNGESIAAMAVAAHEVGHAVQDKEGYFFLKVRSFIYPIVKICSSISYIVIVLGFLLEMLNLIYLGIALVGSGLIFQLITLPVEFNASKRAKESLKKYKLTKSGEDAGIDAMLNSAAMTYVAGVLAAGLQILRFILMIDNRR